MSVAPARTTARLSIEGMNCGACASRITRALRKLEGVHSARVSLADESAAVEFDPARTTLTAISGTIEKAGYRARPS